MEQTNLKQSVRKVAGEKASPPSMVFAPPSVPPLSGDRNVIGGQKPPQKERALRDESDAYEPAN